MNTKSTINTIAMTLALAGMSFAAQAPAAQAPVASTGTQAPAQADKKPVKKHAAHTAVKPGTSAKPAAKTTTPDASAKPATK